MDSEWRDILIATAAVATVVIGAVIWFASVLWPRRGPHRRGDDD